MDPLFSGGSSSSWTAPPVAAYSFLASNPNYIVLLLVATLIPLVLFIENIGKDPSSSMNDMAVAPIIPDFKTDIKVDNEPPSKQDLEKIAELPVLDKGKNSRTFKSLYADNENGSRRVLVIFVRHFFCGVRLLSALPPLRPYFSESLADLLSSDVPRIYKNSILIHNALLPFRSRLTDRNCRHRLRRSRHDIPLHQRNILPIPGLHRSHKKAVSYPRHDINTRHGR